MSESALSPPRKIYPRPAGDNFQDVARIRSSLGVRLFELADWKAFFGEWLVQLQIDRSVCVMCTGVDIFSWMESRKKGKSRKVTEMILTYY